MCTGRVNNFTGSLEMTIMRVPGEFDRRLDEMIEYRLQEWILV